MSDRYQIQGKIGQGGLGAVYKAFDTHLKREVALKRVLTPEEASKDDVNEAAEKLLQEATVLSTLNHPNIVSIFDVGRDESGGFVVMELLDGETLDATVERGLLTLKDFEQVVNQTLEALIAAQSKNMLHRDLKPSNIMVNWLPSGKFQIKILDFGLAKISESPSVQTIDQGDAILGSIYFMAPEQFERRKLMPATDMYAMGCIYYNCLTGKYPFDGESAPQVMASHLQHKVKPLKELRPDLPDDVCQWVMWSINRDMTKRPQSAREALDRFPALDGSEPVFVAQAVVEPARPKVLPSPPKASGTAAGSRVASGPVGAGTRPKTTPQPTPPRKISGRVPTGRNGPATGRTGTATSHQTSHVSAAALLEEMEAKKKRKILIIASVVSVTVMIGIMAIMGMAKAQETQERARIEVLNEPKPDGTAADVALLTKYLGPDKKDPRSPYILGVLNGPGVNAAIIAELRKATDPIARQKLLGVVKAREIPEAFDDVLRIFKAPASKVERTYAAGAIEAIAGRGQFETLMGLLADPSLAESDRSILEDTVVTLVRMEPDTDRRIDPVLNQMNMTSGEVRKSFCRIMGSAGGKSALARLQSIYDGQDLDYQRDAMIALYNWPDRDCLPLIIKVMDTGKDEALKRAAFKAFVQVLAIPTRNPDDSANWKKALSVAPTQMDKASVYGLMAERPFQSTLNYVAANPQKGLEVYDKNVTETIKRTMAAAPVLKSGDRLLWDKAQTRGRPAGLEKDNLAQCITRWTSPETWVQWTFKLDEPGTYEVEIESAYGSSMACQYELICAGDQINFASSSTLDWESFRPMKLTGKIDVTAAEAGVQVLVLRPGKVVGKRLMNLKSVRLTKVP